ncbi:LysR substrate-binding domain-containing protein [Sphingosinicella rhizophila]|uniref:LysR substrate-binding domain-containing protein n=1 Tax=Sphingosinicella rhizophila TaxID=3050082 RepID=A0ABU3QBF4_9SPHN|nr:LysR substrate-binding domain-containing protein [Sphingosinicella sp. GR2756]MDT9600343.1 LysR substrate-binding domain-containing protein [Sphingosinicella sp. GR2756]
MNKRRFLPPMSALNSFAAAARHQSFSLAGEEVGLTQSAVSRQVAVLEDWLQLRLFERTGRRVTLNADGAAYAEAIVPALDRVRAATARMVNRMPQTELNIATLPSFGMRWLAPRLPALSATHPQLVVNFAARTFPFDFADENFDAAIHFGRPDWPGASHVFLFREEAVPVCSPAWLAANPVGQPSDLADKILLHVASRRDGWEKWFDAAGVAPGHRHGPGFDQFLMAARAAAAGTGVALIPAFLIEPELGAGELVIPLELRLRTEDAYYLVHPDSAAHPMLEPFADWLVGQAGSLRDGADGGRA